MHNIFWTGGWCFTIKCVLYDVWRLLVTTAGVYIYQCQEYTIKCVIRSVGHLRMPGRGVSNVDNIDTQL